MSEYFQSLFLFLSHSSHSPPALSLSLSLCLFLSLPPQRNAQKSLCKFSPLQNGFTSSIYLPITLNSLCNFLLHLFSSLLHSVFPFFYCISVLIMLIGISVSKNKIQWWIFFPLILFYICYGAPHPISPFLFISQRGGSVWSERLHCSLLSPYF